jgi:hypothetical protein
MCYSLLLLYAIGNITGTCFFIFLNEIPCGCSVADPESGALLTSRSDPGYFFCRIPDATHELSINVMSKKYLKSLSIDANFY